MDPYLTLLDNIDSFKVYCLLNDTCITEYMKRTNKLWEDWLEKYIKEAYIENTNMIDIGAHIGTCALSMSKYISKNSNIYSFEPIYNKILLKNVLENNLTEQIKTFPIGLSNKSEIIKGEYIDFLEKRNYGFTQLDTLEKLDKMDEISNLCISLETLDSFNIDNVSFIKIDVEGSERMVLEGAINTIYKNCPTILIEIWCTAKSSIYNLNNEKNFYKIKKQFDVFEFLFNMGYICFPVSPSSDDFLFIHHTKKTLINKIVNIL
jgi:FkbM family methyltransferase